MCALAARSDSSGRVGPPLDPRGLDPTRLDLTRLDPTRLDPTRLDPTRYDPIAQALAYGHPALMAVALALVFFALRAGLAMRRRRQSGARKVPGELARHMALARPAVLLAAVGLVSGPVSAFWLRGWTPLQSLHGWLALAAAGLLLAAGLVGRRLSRGESRAVDLHGRLGVLAALVAGLAAFAGFVLLP